MAKPFPTLEGLSSRSNELSYPSPIDVAGVEIDRELTPPRIDDQHQGPRQAEDIGDRTQSTVAPPPPIPLINTTNEELKDVEQPSQANQDPEYTEKTSAFVVLGPPKQPSNIRPLRASPYKREHSITESDISETDASDALLNSQGTKNAQKKTNIWSILCSLSMAVVILAMIAIIAMFVMGFWFSDDRVQKTDTSLADILQNNTILVYQGDPPSISITESVPPSKQKPDISLFVVDCNDLIQRNTSLGISNGTLPFTSNIAVPIPSQHLHYEIGSVIEFIVKVLSATDGSKLSVLIFDNTTQANDYTPSQNPEARKQAIKDWSIATNVSNESTTLCFKPSNGGYFVPVFDIETSGRLVIEYSYQIRQVFYEHTDYEPYPNCSLVVEMCSLNLKETDSQNETCILAYNPRSVEAYQGPTTLQTDIEIEKHKSPNPRCRLCIASYVVMGISILATCACLVCAVKCCTVNITRKKSSSSKDDLALNPPQ